MSTVEPLVALAHLLSHAFVRDALLAGTGIAVASGLVSSFLTLRGQVFTGDALSHVSFTGALAALVIGVDLRIGLFAMCVAVALAMAALGGRGPADDTVIGSVFAWVLGVGALLLSIYTRSDAGTLSTSGTNVLFGSIFGLSAGQAQVSASVAAAVAAAVLLARRPLLFSSVDPAVAAARGVRVRALDFGFLAAVGVTAGDATQAVGALLLLGLLAAPGAAARHVTSRPDAALAVAVTVAVGSVWGGIALAYAFARLPPSFCILSLVTACYVSAAAGARWRRRGGHRRLALSGASRDRP